jgi:alpha-D-xyloside xylohydrolase
VPLGSMVESTHDKQTIEHVRVYPGTDGELTLYNDGGLPYACEKGEGEVPHLRWDNAKGKLTEAGTMAWSGDPVLQVARER